MVPKPMFECIALQMWHRPTSPVVFGVNVSGLVFYVNFTNRNDSAPFHEHDDVTNRNDSAPFHEVAIGMMTPHGTQVKHHCSPHFFGGGFCLSKDHNARDRVCVCVCVCVLTKQM